MAPTNRRDRSKYATLIPFRVGLDYADVAADNHDMIIPGRVKNGVVVLKGGPALPDGTAVTVSCELPPGTTQSREGRVKFPLVHSKRPGSLHLTAQRVAELLEEEDAF